VRSVVTSPGSRAGRSLLCRVSAPRSPGIAYAVGQALYPVGQKILTFFKDLFSGPNLKKYASAFLGLVEEIGRIIGTIVSSPAFLKAVAAIAAAAVIIGFRFVEGLARGIASNLPELVGMLRDGLVAGLKALWSNPLILVSAIVLAPLAARLFSLFRNMGTGAGTGFTAGLKTAMTGARGGAAALFGGLSGAVTSNALAANRAFRKEQQNLINQTRILGGDTSIISPRTMDEARAQLKRLGEGVTETQMKALRWRDTMQQAGIAVKGVFSGLGQTLKAIGPALAAPIRGYVAALKATDVYTGPGTSGAKAFAGAFRSSLSASKAQLVDGLRGSLSALENFAHSQGNSIGKQLALGVQRGATVALAAVGGFLAGKAEGASGGSGITSALTAGLVGASVGGPLVGAVAAGASVIGTAFGKAEHAAKVFKERMSEIGSTVRGDLEAALKSGKIAVLDFKSAFSLKGDEGLTDEITSLLKTDTKQALQDAGVSAQELMAAFREGEPAVAKLLKSIGLVFDDTIGFNKAERAAADVGTVFAGVATEIARINLDEAFNPTKIDKAATSANGFWSRMVGGARDFNTTASAARAVQDATDKVALYETALETAKGAWDSLFNIPGDTNLQESDRQRPHLGRRDGPTDRRRSPHWWRISRRPGSQHHPRHGDQHRVGHQEGRGGRDGPDPRAGGIHHEGDLRRRGGRHPDRLEGVSGRGRRVPGGDRRGRSDVAVDRLRCRHAGMGAGAPRSGQQEPAERPDRCRC
jgi:hypothetical protein